MAVLGPNGSGKSSLLHALGGLVEVSLTACNNRLFQSMMTPAVARAGVSAPIMAEQTTRTLVFMMDLAQSRHTSERP